MKRNIRISLVCILLVTVIAAILYFTCTATGVETWNNWFHKVQEANDRSNYQTKRMVESTCRAMIASYDSDKLTYEQYKDSGNAEQQSWAQQARMRANKTASSYNNYILENRYVWKNNIPSDIRMELSYIQ